MMLKQPFIDAMTNSLKLAMESGDIKRIVRMFRIVLHEVRWHIKPHRQRQVSYDWESFEAAGWGKKSKVQSLGPDQETRS